MKYSLLVFSILMGILLTYGIRGANASSLNLDQFLDQVRAQNQGFKGSLESTQAGQERSGEGNLALAPAFFANYQYLNDSKPPPIPIYNYDSQNINTLSVGFSKLTSFGLLAKLRYDVYENNIINISFPSSGPPGSPSNSTSSFVNPFYQTAPTLELSQSLWGNGFGAATRANRDLIEAQALASSYNASFQTKLALANAEASFWRLASDRQSLLVEKQALTRAQDIYNRAIHREKLHLGDRSDSLQAEAALKLRSLQIQSTQDEARSAALSFNSARNLDSDAVPETLPSLGAEEVLALNSPKRGGLRDDAKAAAEQIKITDANSALSRERDSGVFDVFGSVALNGRAGDLGTALSGPFNQGKPTAAIGFRLNVPLDPLVYRGIQSGWAKEKQAGELLLERKIFEDHAGWVDLDAKINEARRRLELSSTIEKIQKEKLANEETRLSQGRTTTYQVLSFEQDFLSAQVSRIRAQTDVLELLAQMKLYGDRS